MRTGVQAQGTNARFHEVTFIARVHTFVVKEQEIVRAGEAVVLGRTHARLASRVTRVAMTIVVVLGCKERNALVIGRVNH